MPELPDVTVYVEALEKRIVGATLEKIRFASPFVLRTVSPSTADLAGKPVQGLRRIGKRIVIELEGELFIVIHLMIAGRLAWSAAGAKIPAKRGLAAFDFTSGTLLLTESGAKKRASIHLISGEGELAGMDRGGIDPLEVGAEDFRARITAQTHTLKRTLTDPRLFSGIGNAYSDEILHRARLSPMQLSTNLSAEEAERLRIATREVLTEWIDRLRADSADRFPEKVTAFRPEMAVHGKFGEPCPVCGSPVQRIVYADNETNYCARCQTGGRVLADRALSRLLKSDWPRSIDEWEGERG